MFLVGLTTTDWLTSTYSSNRNYDPLSTTKMQITWPVLVVSCRDEWQKTFYCARKKTTKLVFLCGFFSKKVFRIVFKDKLQMANQQNEALWHIQWQQFGAWWRQNNLLWQHFWKYRDSFKRRPNRLLEVKKFWMISISWFLNWWRRELWPQQPNAQREIGKSRDGNWHCLEQHLNERLLERKNAWRIAWLNEWKIAWLNEWKIAWLNE